MVLSYSRRLLLDLALYLSPSRPLPLSKGEEEDLWKKRIKYQFPRLPPLINENISYKDQYLGLMKILPLEIEGKYQHQILTVLDLHQLEAQDLINKVRWDPLDIFGQTQVTLIQEVVSWGSPRVLEVLLGKFNPNLRERDATEYLKRALQTLNIPVVKYLLGLSYHLNNLWIEAFKKITKLPKVYRETTYSFCVWFYSKAPMEVQDQTLWKDISNPLLPLAFFEASPRISPGDRHYVLAIRTLRKSAISENLTLFKRVYSKINFGGALLRNIVLPEDFLKYLSRIDFFRALCLDNQIELILGENRLPRLKVILDKAATPKRIERVFELSLEATLENELNLGELCELYGDLLTAESWAKLLQKQLDGGKYNEKTLELALTKGITKDILWPFLEPFPTDPDPREAFLVSCLFFGSSWTLGEVERFLYRYREARYFYLIFLGILENLEDPQDPRLLPAKEHALSQSLQEGDWGAVNRFFEEGYLKVEVIPKISREVLEKAYRGGLVIKGAPEILRETIYRKEEVLDWWTD